MKCSTFIVAAMATIAAGGCASPDRSRNLADPAVPAATIARQVCSNCHGVTGSATSPNFPNLAGQPEAYVVAQLDGFRSRARQDPAGFEYMWGLSRGLTDEQIKGLAAYYAGQPPAAQPIEGRPDRYDAGRSVFRNGVADRNIPACTTCHGNEGEGQATFPRLAGQHADYVVKQLLVFQRTDARPEGGIMKTISHELTAQDIEDVAGYVQSLTGK